MASLVKCFIAIVSLFLLLITQSAALTSKAIVLKVAKDPLTGQHTAVVHQGTPLVPLKLSLDLGGDSLWTDCENGYNSSSYRSLNCNEDPRCLLLRPLGCDKESCFEEGAPWFCNPKACVTGVFNPFSATWDESYLPGQNWYEGGEAAEDVLSLRYTTRDRQVALASQFLFTCVPTWFPKGLVAGVWGVAGLGPTAGALPTQIGQTFGLQRKFMVCLTSSTKSTGAVVFGDFPVVTSSTPIIPSSTPLLKNPASNQSFVVRLYSEYYINVTSIKVNGRIVPVDTTLLSFYNSNGDGGTKISTADPYAVLKSPIYKALVDAFIGGLPTDVKRVSPPAGSPPFEVCFSGVPVTSRRLPSLSLVLEDAEWKFSGRNLFVQVKEGVTCLGFVEDRRLLQDQEGASVVIGAQQIEDHLLGFDLSTYSLSVSKISCAKFGSTIARKA